MFKHSSNLPEFLLIFQGRVMIISLGKVKSVGLEN